MEAGETRAVKIQPEDVGNSAVLLDNILPYVPMQENGSPCPLNYVLLLSNCEKYLIYLPTLRIIFPFRPGYITSADLDRKMIKGTLKALTNQTAQRWATRFLRVTHPWILKASGGLKTRCLLARLRCNTCPLAARTVLPCLKRKLCAIVLCDVRTLVVRMKVFFQS